jgi:hypothetical protein
MFCVQVLALVFFVPLFVLVSGVIVAFFSPTLLTDIFLAGTYITMMPLVAIYTRVLARRRGGDIDGKLFVR